MTTSRLCLSVTTTYSEPPPPNHLPLPFNPDPRRVKTGLARRSAAVVDWLVTAYPDELGSGIGDVPRSILTELQRRLAGLM